MPDPEDLINFEVIENQKENILSLPGGRSARKLAHICSPSTPHSLGMATPSDIKSVNDCIRAEYEAEIDNISESDDPLDIFDRYVRWTLDAYPSAQATPQSLLQTLLERATKTFISSTQYKNDPRYLKLWMQYIHFYTETSREIYLFLSRHGIGDGLALFYEEYAAWLEGANRWAQADEVFKLGIQREARPAQRLLRKFKEFEARLARQPEEAAAPSSPALPAMRPALAVKTNPFGASARSTEPQAPQREINVDGKSLKPTKANFTIFSDAGAKPAPLSTTSERLRGWETVGSATDRKKENTVQAKPWVGETLRAGGRRSGAPKMAVFRDKSISSQINNVIVVPSENQARVHPATGRKERIFVDLATLYRVLKRHGTELSFEEIVAANRGWIDFAGDDDTVAERQISETEVKADNIDKIGRKLVDELLICRGAVMFDENGTVMPAVSGPRPGKEKRAAEVNETQIIKTKLDSPLRPKLRKKTASEPTMTLHTKAATDDIYEIFNAPLPTSGLQCEVGNVSVNEDDYETDGDYATDLESTGMTRVLEANSREEGDPSSASKSLFEWSDFTSNKHVPGIEPGDQIDRQGGKAAFDNGAVLSPDDDDDVGDLSPTLGDHTPADTLCSQEEDELGEGVAVNESPPITRTVFVPISPEDYDAPTLPFKDPVEAANSRLPFMTPITERTECSLDVDAERYKTPCKGGPPLPVTQQSLGIQQLSSPLMEIKEEEASAPPVTETSSPPFPRIRPCTTVVAKAAPRPILVEGPVIKDKQCNPVDTTVRQEILAKANPPLKSYFGFYDHVDDKHEQGSEIRRFAKALSKGNKGGTDKSAIPSESLTIKFSDIDAEYGLKRELGVGAFAPVYLVEKLSTERETSDDDAVAVMEEGFFTANHRSRLEALKIESPPTPWEFHMMRVAHARIGPQHRMATSLSYAHEMHLYRDEAFLLLPYYAHGTLLDVVNLFRTEPSGVMDELLAMFFTVELLRTTEALHSKGILHGDLKPDNCLLRLDNMAHERELLAGPWRADGGGGWSSRGIVLIDFGRAIDMRAFVPDVEFIADWKTSAQDCAEMREGRPWTWQIDYHGLAGTVHCLLFGKYMETTRCDQVGLGRTGRRYKIRESLKRYWQTDLWAALFEMLLNPSSVLEAEDGARMPVLRSMRCVRERMEAWLEANCERGVGLRSLLGKLETHAKNRRA